MKTESQPVQPETTTIQPEKKTLKLRTAIKAGSTRGF